MWNKSSVFALLIYICCHGLPCAVLAEPGSQEERMGRHAYDRGQYREAIVHYQRLLQTDPDNAEYRLRLASSYESQGDLERAEEHADKILAKHSMDVSALLLMARIRERQDDWKTAKDLYKRVIRADADVTEAHLGLGQALMQLGDETAADAEFSEFRRLTGMGTP